MPRNHTSQSSGGSNGTASAAAAARAAKMARQRLFSERAAKYYAAGIVGMIAIFALFHWTRYLYSRYASKKLKKSGIMKGQISIVR